jgi:hypothetical protein
VQTGEGIPWQSGDGLCALHRVLAYSSGQSPPPTSSPISRCPAVPTASNPTKPHCDPALPYSCFDTIRSIPSNNQ